MSASDSQGGERFEGYTALRSSWADEQQGGAKLAQQTTSTANGNQRQAPVRNFVFRSTNPAEQPAPQQPQQQSFMFSATEGGVKATRTPRRGFKSAKTRAPTPGPPLFTQESSIPAEWGPKTEQGISTAFTTFLNINADTSTSDSRPSTGFVFTAGVNPSSRTSNGFNPQQQAQPFIFGASNQQPAQQQQQQQQDNGFVSIVDAGQTPLAPRRIKHKERRTVRSAAKPARPPTKLEYAAPPAVQQQAPLGGASNVAEGRIPAQGPPPAPFDLAQIAMDKAASAAASYRNQGNEAFRVQNYQLAHSLYTKAAEAVWPYPKLHPQLALFLCNRAAACLSLGLPLQALQDCRMGLQYDPSYAKCVLRKATCHVRLGEYELARMELRKLEQAAKVDAQLATEVAKKAEEINAVETKLLAVLTSLGHKVSEAPAASQTSTGIAGLHELNTLLGHSPHAAIIHAAKAEALIRTGDYRQAKTVVESPLHMEPGHDTRNISNCDVSKSNLWRFWIAVQVAYHTGNVEEACQGLNACIQKLDEPSGFGNGFSASSNASKSTDGAKSLVDIVIPLPAKEEMREIQVKLQESQRLRSEGNAAMQVKNYKVALKAYSDALDTPGLSAAMAGLLFSNRAAAYQGLGDLSLALADCCRAKALAPRYAKAYSRMASLLVEVQLNSDAADQLEIAVTLPDIDANTKKEYERRAKQAKQDSEKKADYYKLLGVDKAEGLEQIRKAYKKLALQLHPDKAIRTAKFSCQLTSKGSLVTESEEPLTRLKDNVTWLFKCLAEAHDTLTDKQKRHEYDMELRMAARRNNFASRQYSSYDGHHYSAYGGFARDPYADYMRSTSAYGGYARSRGQNPYANRNRQQNTHTDWSYWSFN